MRTFKSKTNPLVVRPYYPQNDIEETCINELRKLELLPENPEPIRIDRFVEKRFGITLQYENLDEGLLGFTRFGEKGVDSIVITNSFDEEGSQVSNRRFRTTIAHEAGHGLLHGHLFALEKKSKNIFGESHDETSRVMCRNVQGTEKRGKVYNGEWWEHQANLMMSALLLPRTLMHKAITPYLKSEGILGGLKIDPAKKTQAIKNLAQVFDVNPIVVEIRLEQLFPLTDSPQLSL